jgi:hypothetical protein
MYTDVKCSKDTSQKESHVITPNASAILDCNRHHLGSSGCKRDSPRVDLNLALEDVLLVLRDRRPAKHIKASVRTFTKVDE